MVGTVTYTWQQGSDTNVFQYMAIKTEKNIADCLAINGWNRVKQYVDGKNLVERVRYQTFSNIWLEQ